MAAPSPWHITSFYRFLTVPADEVRSVRDELLAVMRQAELMGLTIVAPEGINGTVAGSWPGVEALKAHLTQRFSSEVRFKDSISEEPPFRRLSVVTRREIVGMKRPELVPSAPYDHHLSPSEWHAMLSSPRPPLVIDTRNSYEFGVGRFRGAIDPGLKSFSEWGDHLRLAEYPKDEPVLIYCTGGIRCEKAILEMRAQGFEKVYQLRDGILGYLAEYPEGHYEGECYVFDDRVAVDAHLRPSSRFSTCPGCGLAADVERHCAWCGEPFRTCEGCMDSWPDACDKTCRDRLQRHGPKVDFGR
jgi:UPF0176 protein